MPNLCIILPRTELNIPILLILNPKLTKNFILEEKIIYKNCQIYRLFRIGSEEWLRSK